MGLLTIKPGPRLGPLILVQPNFIGCARRFQRHDLYFQFRSEILVLIRSSYEAVM